MHNPDLAKYHETSRALDFITPMQSLLDEFRQGNIADRRRTREDATLKSHLGSLIAAWDHVFPAFPRCPWRRRTFLWEYNRGKRDKYLSSLIIRYMKEFDSGRRLIVNPATVFGRHARSLARNLPGHDVMSTDIFPVWNHLYRVACFWKCLGLKNFQFVRENIFKPHLQRNPAVVTFWGACGSVTDACMDYAIATASPFLICRSCCHDNIGGNTEVVKRRTPINAFFRWKNRSLAKMKRKEKWKDFYFSKRYLADAYPRSTAARELMDSDTIMAVARNTADSDICRSLIDLDRCLYLQEHGYDVLYREELFFAHIRVSPARTPCA